MLTEVNREIYRKHESVSLIIILWYSNYYDILFFLLVIRNKILSYICIANNYSLHFLAWCSCYTEEVRDQALRPSGNRLSLEKVPTPAQGNAGHIKTT